jgi:hypothetical protein
MKARAIATLAVLAFTAAFAPLTALPATDSTVRYDLNTRVWQPGFGGQYEGLMRLRITPDGVVRGTFRMSGGPTQLIDVIGGLTGPKIWLQIGNRTLRQQTFNGTLIDGKLAATAPGNTLNPWKLEGKPAKF